MGPMICAFDELTLEQQPPAGGKGGTLAQLYQAGYPVPDGVVVLPSAFAGDEMLPEAWAQMKAHLARVRSEDPQAAFAVRSSALAEDSARASFAGEFETVLNVRTDEAIRDAIHAVRQSRHSERVQAYSQARGLDGGLPGKDQPDEDHEMALIVQRLVPAEISGVLFTADPVSGNRSQMTGNYVHGLGEKLVSGSAKPHEFTISRPKGRYEGPSELKPFARHLFKLARRLERDLGSPQDIEWAIAGNQRPRRTLYILQSRPITTLQGFDPATGEFNDSLTGDYHWSCVNVGEAMSVVMTPFTWSLLRMIFAELDLLPGYAAVGNIGGRMYQNVSVGISVLRALGKNVKDMAKEMGGVRDEYLAIMDQFLDPLPGANLLTILPNAIQARRKEKRGLKNLDAFFTENPAWCQSMSQIARTARTGEELVSQLDEIIPHVLQTFWRNYATALRYGAHVGRLRRELTEMAGAADADALLSNVSDTNQLLASLGPAVGLARVARGELSREAYLEQWGHRGALETEISVPRPAEDPEWLDRQLAAFARMQSAAVADVEALLEAQRAKFDAAWERFQNRYPRKIKSTQRRLEEAAEAARTREAARSEATREVGVARAWALRAGEITGLGDNIFFLMLDEVLNLLSGQDAPMGTIPTRRETYERYKALPPYPLIIRGRFDPVRWAADPNRRSDHFDSHGLLEKLTIQAPQENMILGTPGSAGLVEGVVRRLDTPEKGDELQAGEILVTSQTNIGWTIFFPRAGAIVTDIGAALSHAAIVAREMGIPAVVNCGIATMRLQTGDRVRVDGGQGIVEILETD